MKGVHFDDVLTEVGQLGPYQIMNIILIGAMVLVVGAHHVAAVFLAGVPKFHCVDRLDTFLNGSYLDMSMQNIGSLHYDPGVYNASTIVVNDQTVVPSKDECVVSTDNGTEACTKWVYEKDIYESTITTEWDLVCSDEFKHALAQSIYMCGVLVGALVVGSLSDACGRRTAMFGSHILMVISAATAAFMPNYWLFVAMRFVVGATACGMFTSGFVLMMEVLGTDHRMVAGIFFQVWFALGYMLLAVVAYFLRDYQHIQLTIALAPVVCIGYWWWIHESPRWLLLEGYYEACEKEVRRMARMNKRPAPEHLLSVEMDALTHNNNDEEVKLKTEKYSILVLLKTPNLRRKTLNSWFQWMMISMIYYGLSMGVGGLAGGPYLNLVISGFMEILACVIAVLILDRIGRRLPLSVFNLVGGFACIAMAIIPAEYSVIITCFSMVGKLATSGSFALIYVYSAELFPTVIRTIGVGSGSMFARVGSLLSPFIALTGSVWKPLPYLIFGASSVMAGILALFLPETLHQPMPETIEEGEEFGKNSHKQLFKIHQDL